MLRELERYVVPQTSIQPNGSLTDTSRGHPTPTETHHNHDRASAASRPDRRSLRIGYIIQNSAPDMEVISGPLLHIRAVTEGLRARGHTVRVIVPYRGQYCWTDNLSQPEWRTVNYGVSASRVFRSVESVLRRVQRQLHIPYLNLFESFRFSEAVCETLAGYDIIFERYGWMGYGGQLASSRMRVPLILEINGNFLKEMEILETGMSRPQRSVSVAIAHRTLAAASKIVCVAPALKRQFVTQLGLRPEQIAVIPNGADVTLFLAPKDRNAIYRRYALERRPTVTFVGSFQPWHGVDLLIESFAQVVAQVPNAQLVLVGDDQGRFTATNASSIAGLEEKIRFMGRMRNDQVADILAVTDIAVAPFPYKESDIVGSPLKLYEYMAAGCAVVASWAPIHDAVEDGVTGLRVPPADAQALAQTIMHLLDDESLRQKLGNTARQAAAERHSWDHAISSLEDLAFDAIKRTPTP